MTDRKDLRERVDDLRQEFGVDDDGGVLILPGVSGSDIDLSPYTAETEMPADDPITSYEVVQVPRHRPPEYRGGVVVLTAEDIRELWEQLPEDVLDAEREFRQAEGEPLPPILKE